MKKLMFVLAVPVMIVAALTVAEVTGGCGLLDAADEIWIGPITQTFDFELNADDPEFLALLRTKCGCDPSTLTQFPPGLTFELELEAPPQKVDLTNEEKLKDYNASLVKDINIESVKYTIDQNSFNYDLPKMEIWMDGYDANGITASSKLVATLPSIPAKSTDSGALVWETDGRDILSDYLTSFKFAIIGKVTINIDTDTNTAIPSGLLKGAVEVQVKFSFDPLP